MSELLPCPFCGGEDVDPRGWLNGMGDRGPECLGCGATAGTVDIWNTRPREQQIIRETKEQVREACVKKLIDYADAAFDDGDEDMAAILHEASGMIRRNLDLDEVGK